jgi:hypothetical protein
MTNTETPARSSLLAPGAGAPLNLTLVLATAAPCADCGAPLNADCLDPFCPGSGGQIDYDSPLWEHLLVGV